MRYLNYYSKTNVVPQHFSSKLGASQLLVNTEFNWLLSYLFLKLSLFCKLIDYLICLLVTLGLEIHILNQ